MAHSRRTRIVATPVWVIGVHKFTGPQCPERLPSSNQRMIFRRPRSSVATAAISKA